MEQVLNEIPDYPIPPIRRYDDATSQTTQPHTLDQGPTVGQKKTARAPGAPNESIPVKPIDEAALTRFDIADFLCDAHITL
jgi:hypothetical protein